MQINGGFFQIGYWMYGNILWLALKIAFLG